MSLPRVTGLVSTGNIRITCQKSPPNHGTAVFDKLPLETEPVAHGNNVVLTSKLCPQTFLVPYSTDNRSTTCCNMLRVVGSSLKMIKFFSQLFGCCMMLYSFGHFRATLLRRSMRTSSICYFNALSNMLQQGGQPHATCCAEQHLTT